MWVNFQSVLVLHDDVMDMKGVGLGVDALHKQYMR